MSNFDKLKVDSLKEKTMSRSMDENIALFFAQYQGKPDFSRGYEDYLSWIKEKELANKPQRTNLSKLDLISPLDERFCDENYMYLLRGDYQNCDFGFYSYQYSFGEETVESLIENYTIEEIYYYIYGQFPNVPLDMTSTDLLASIQTNRGGSPFISTTTNYETANYFAFCKKGRVYVIRVKKENVVGALLKVNTAYQETEYLIPDFIDSEEIVASFDYTDYMGVKNYLNDVANLGVADKDLIPSVYGDSNAFSYRELMGIGVNLPPFENPHKEKGE